MFDGNFKEALSGRIIIDNIEYEQLLALLLYIYTDVIEPNTLQMVYDLFCSSGLFDLANLKLKTEKILIKCINIENALLLWETAEVHQSKELMLNCLSIIRRNFTNKFF